MIRLNTTQEKYLINYMIDNPELFVDSGSSRAVFNCPAELANYLQLPDRGDENYIIKIALGKGGIAQMNVEVETFIEYKESGVLADIVAVGRYIEIMENVKVEEFYDAAEERYSIDDIMDVYCLSEEEAAAIYRTIATLEGIFGHTADNGQLGLNHNGDWVAYDYGFIASEDIDSQTSSISGYISYKGDRNEYLQGLISLLDKEEDFMEEWEKTFLGKNSD